MLNTGKLAGRTLLITGASRGIGKAIALKAARDGANIVIAAKTATPHPKLPGTIYTAAEEVQKAGGVAYPVVLDVRDENAVRKAIKGAVDKFGGIDIVVNNASAISLLPTAELDMKRYDLMHNINTRGTFLVSKECIPYLMKSNHAHILNISPPLNLNPRWFRDHVAYTMAKYGMSMCVLGMSGELQDKGIGVNALWPRTAIYTAAIEMLQGKESMKHTRKPDIMADAAYAILTREPNRCTGNFFIDDEVLLAEGITDLSQYASDPNSTEDLMPDFFLDTEEPTEKKTLPTINSNVPDDVLLSQIFNKIQKVLSEDVVQNVKATYQFNIDDKKVKWYLDLKNGKGNCQNGECPQSADVTLSMTSRNLSDMFSGNLKAIPAFMSGKLKISGDMQKAMKLEKLLRAYKSKL